MQTIIKSLGYDDVSRFRRPFDNYGIYRTVAMRAGGREFRSVNDRAIPKATVLAE